MSAHSTPQGDPATPERCEPPEKLRGKDGLHWIQRNDDAPIIATWTTRFAGWNDLGLWSNPVLVAQDGYRYLCPIPRPAEITAAKEREAALVGVLVDIYEMITNCGDCPTNPDSLPQMVRYHASAILDTHAPDWRTTP